MKNHKGICFEPYGDTEYIFTPKSINDLWSFLKGVYIENKYYNIEDKETISSLLSKVDEEDFDE